jgi:hypothetical protein
MAHAVSLAVPGESLGLDREPLGTVCAVRHDACGCLSRVAL